MNRTAKGNLYLIPTTIGTEKWESVIPHDVIEITRSLNCFVVEELRTARRYLSRIGVHTPIDEITFFTLNEHTNPVEVESMMKPLLGGVDVGLISEAGMPAIADPGSLLVAAAHLKGIKIIPLVGPNSIVLTLMASGLNGQNFAFVGYLPVKPQERKNRLRQLENRSRTENQTQLFIEAPYRNLKLFQDILSACSNATLLTIGSELTTPEEFIATKSITDWKKSPEPSIHKKNTVFAILG